MRVALHKFEMRRMKFVRLNISPSSSAFRVGIDENAESKHFRKKMQ
jgi:hypothetical protein